MTDEQRFTRTMAVMMGKHIHNWEIHFSDSLGSYGYKYFTCSCGAWEWSKTSDWSPIIEGELTPECRKWWADNLPDAWNRYLHACQGVWEHSSTTLNKQLDWRNLWKWMRENTNSWLYRKCTTCNGSGLWYKGGDKEFCISCNGTGRVARCDVEKWLEVKCQK